MAIEIPAGWCEPTYQIGEVVWHECQQYEVIGLCIDKRADAWRYLVNRYPESAHNHNPQMLSLLEHQVGLERAPWCDAVEDDPDSEPDIEEISVPGDPDYIDPLAERFLE
jgi:hypothetical protein